MSLVNKVTIGHVVQTYETKSGEFTNQKFVASTESCWENDIGKSVDAPEVDGNEAYLPFDMKHPDD